MKFGGTSVGSVPAIDRTAEIIKSHYDETQPPVIVLSAMSGITNRLVAICENLEVHNKQAVEKNLIEVFDMHMDAVSRLRLDPTRRAFLKRELRNLYINLREEVDSVETITDHLKASITGFGELPSVHMNASRLAELGIPAFPVDAALFLETDSNFLEARPNLESVRNRSKAFLFNLLNSGAVPVVTGFRGVDFFGRNTVLGRGGSDYTASILGKVLNSKEVYIWTDVEGVFTEDPRKNPNAKVIPEMTFIDADRMAKAGAKVLYTKTVEPLMETDTIVWVKNTFKPNEQGTKIVRSI